MSDDIATLDRADEDILAYDVADETPETAAGMEKVRGKFHAHP